MVEKKQQEVPADAVEKLRQLEKIAHHIEKIRMGDYIEMMARPRRIIWVNFLGGVSRGVGLTVGATLVIAVLFKIISAVIAMNIPYLTDMLQEVVQIVKETPAGKGINVSPAPFENPSSVSVTEPALSGEEGLPASVK